MRCVVDENATLPLQFIKIGRSDLLRSLTPAESTKKPFYLDWMNELPLELT